MRRWMLLLAWFAWPAGAAGQGPPGTEIYLVSFRISAGGVAVGAPKRLTDRPGYDNQPAFSPDGRSVYYTSVRDGGPGGTTQADIFRVDLATGRQTAVIETPESEYSATPIPGSAEIAVIRVEQDSAQRLWAFPTAGGPPRLLVEGLKPVGYQAWLDRTTVGLYVLGAPATLQLADLATGRSTVLLSRIGRAVQRIPGRRALSVTQQVTDSVWWIVEVDPATAATKPVVKMPEGAEYYVWLADGSLLSAKDSSLYRYRPGTDREWQRSATLSGLSGLTRLALSPRGDALAVVANEEKP